MSQKQFWKWMQVVGFIVIIWGVGGCVATDAMQYSKMFFLGWVIYGVARFMTWMCDKNSK